MEFKSRDLITLIPLGDSAVSGTRQDQAHYRAADTLGNCPVSTIIPIISFLGYCKKPKETPVQEAIRAGTFDLASHHKELKRELRARSEIVR